MSGRAGLRPALFKSLHTLISPQCGAVVLIFLVTMMTGQKQSRQRWGVGEENRSLTALIHTNPKILNVIISSDMLIKFNDNNSNFALCET